MSQEVRTPNDVPLIEVLSQPFTEETLEARQVLHGLHGGFVQLMEERQLAEVEGEPEAVAGRREFHFPPSEYGGELSLDEKADFLRNSFDRIHVEDYVNYGFRIGAARMDQQRVADGQEPMHLSIVEDLLSSEQADNAKQAGYEDDWTGAGYGVPGLLETEKYAKAIVKEFGKGLVNPVVLMRAGGMHYQSKTSAGAAILSDSLNAYVRHQKWPPRLLAMTGLLAMHHASMRSARENVTPFLRASDQLPTITPGKEQAYWKSKVVGYERSEGSMYHVGYLEKSRVLTRIALHSEWDNDYVRNRQVLTSTLLMNPHIFPKAERSKMMGKIKKPILLLIKEGYFAAAFEKLQEAAVEYPALFAPIGREALLRGIKDAPKLANDSPENI